MYYKYRKVKLFKSYFYTIVLGKRSKQDNRDGLKLLAREKTLCRPGWTGWRRPVKNRPVWHYDEMNKSK